LSEENAEKQSAHAVQYDCCCFSARNKMAVSSNKKAKVSQNKKRENVETQGTKPCLSAFLYERNDSL
jgi:hypothetical protein